MVVDYVAANPEAGDLIKESGGIRKVRFARPGMGKSGGWRVLTAYLAEFAPTLLITVYSKNRRGNISKAEVKELAKFMKDAKAAIRKIAEARGAK